MPKKRSWTDDDLRQAVESSTSIRQVLKKLHLVPAGGNYVQVSNRIADINLDTGHLNGKGWRKGNSNPTVPAVPLNQLLVNGSRVQSFKLKKKLFDEKLKKPKCEICGWCEMSVDGRIPVELDHINGDKLDNRLQNLRVLCPNCHSLQTTHRGKNKHIRLLYKK